MTATQIRNVTGIHDDVFLNAACDAERKENLASEIAKMILREHGYEWGNLYEAGRIFSYQKICDVLKEFGFVWLLSDDEREEHCFVNKDTNDEISIFPKTYYTMQGNMKFENFLLS